jgi:hypothetical protein
MFAFFNCCVLGRRAAILGKGLWPSRGTDGSGMQ